MSALGFPRWLLAPLVGALALTACTYEAHYPNGVVGCLEDKDCLGGYVCVALAPDAPKVCCQGALCGLDGATTEVPGDGARPGDATGPTGADGPPRADASAGAGDAARPELEPRAMGPQATPRPPMRPCRAWTWDPASLPRPPPPPPPPLRDAATPSPDAATPSPDAPTPSPDAPARPHPTPPPRPGPRRARLRARRPAALRWLPGQRSRTWAGQHRRVLHRCHRGDERRLPGVPRQPRRQHQRPAVARV